MQLQCLKYTNEYGIIRLGYLHLFILTDRLICIHKKTFTQFFRIAIAILLRLLVFTYYTNEIPNYFKT